jgi:hypothetical protein
VRKAGGTGIRFTSLVNRGTLLFGTGLALTIREALTKGPERPSLYVLFAGMMGMPLVWQSQALREEQKKLEAKAQADAMKAKKNKNGDDGPDG